MVQLVPEFGTLDTHTPRRSTLVPCTPTPAHTHTPTPTHNTCVQVISGLVSLLLPPSIDDKYAEPDATDAEEAHGRGEGPPAGPVGKV